jgi:hypothetical protein
VLRTEVIMEKLLSRLVDFAEKLVDEADDAKQWSDFLKEHQRVRMETCLHAQKIERKVQQQLHPEQTVAVYSGLSAMGMPVWQGRISEPTTVGDLLITPTPSGVEVRWFGTFGPERTTVRSGREEHIFTKGTVAVL